MVATAPESTAERGAPGWLDAFLADWHPGTGEPREIREPATGRPLLTLEQSTVDDVRRITAAAAAAQPAWAETNYQERAAILRRAAEIYEAHRPEFGTWTQRETGAHRNKMHHEQNFTAQELLNASTLPSQPLGSILPSAQPERLSMVRRVPLGVVGAITPWNSPSVLGMRVVAPAFLLSELTTAMGINSPSLYAAFGSKEALFLEATDLYTRSEGTDIWSTASSSFP